MQLSNILSNTNIQALYAAATSKSDAEKYAPALTDYQREQIYDFAAAHKCALNENFWRDVQSGITREFAVIIAVKDKTAVVENAPKSALFARHIGAMLKRGYALLWVNCAREITWDNWTDAYAALLPAAVDTRQYDKKFTAREMSELKTARGKEKEFYDLARPNRCKKSGRVRISFEEARALRITAQRASMEARVAYEAEKIFTSAN